MEKKKDKYKNWLIRQYPLTIIKDRYTSLFSEGEYEERKWIAFPLRFDEVPMRVNGSDLEQFNFLEFYGEPFGTGKTPEEAVSELEKKIRALLGKKRIKRKTPEGYSWLFDETLDDETEKEYLDELLEAVGERIRMESERLKQLENEGGQLNE